MSDAAVVSGVAGRYATALFELADETGALDAVERHLDTLDAALRESEDLRAMVASPVHGRDEQGAAMAALCRAMAISAPTAGLLGLMAANRRLFVLRGVIDGFRALLAKKRGIVTAEVHSAAPLSDAQRASLADTLARATGSQIALKEIVDDGLIGGLVVKVGSKMIDTSIRAKLAKLQTMMKEAGI